MGEGVVMMGLSSEEGVFLGFVRGCGWVEGESINGLILISNFEVLDLGFVLEVHGF